MSFDIVKSLTNEFTHECANTRKVLERVPMDKLTWKPHEKSMSLQLLASHTAEIPEWVPHILQHSELDFAQQPYQPKRISSLDDLLKIHDDATEAALAAIAKTNAAVLVNETWTMRNGDTILLSLPKIATLRTVAFNHLYHHRGQLTVYLRLLNIPVPGIFGPSADEQ